MGVRFNKNQVKPAKWIIDRANAVSENLLIETK